jgi:PIN like domain
MESAMRDRFSGYFTPSVEEFDKLWAECVFAFDANVLLGLYASTPDTQNVFFSVLDKIAHRIFLPHQAASEYFKNRLNKISVRSDQYEKIKDESQRLSTFVESIVREHAILNGNEIEETARNFAKTIGKQVNASAEAEPDLVRSDAILDRLADLFKSSTGQSYSPDRQKEIYALGAQRYSQSIPPGYKDDKKNEPAKYGDLLIWFQLIDHVKSVQKPIIFVTGDAKEDWIQQHRGEALGPRPELRQEMMSSCNANFWMYTTPRFLEFAKVFLQLKIDTKQAESEFEKIEKQATELEALPDINYYYDTSVFPQAIFSKGVGWNTAVTQPMTYGLSGAEVSYAGWTAPADTGPKQEFLQLLPLNGVVFNPPNGRWTCKIESAPSDKNVDRASYTLDFQPQDHSMPTRTLKLWVSLAALERDSDWSYKKALNTVIFKWLLSNQVSGEATLVP